MFEFNAAADNYAVQTLLNCFWSLSRVVAGVTAAAFFGITCGLLRHMLPSRLRYNTGSRFLLEVLTFQPPLAWLGLVVFYFGIGEISACIIVMIGAFSPIFKSSYDGAESIPLIIRQTASSMEIKGWRYFRHILLPAASPMIFTGLRNGIGMGWMSIIGAEMIIGGSYGLGYSLQLNRLNLQQGLMWIDFLTIGVTGFILHNGAVRLENKTLPWHDSGLSQGGDGHDTY